MRLLDNVKTTGAGPWFSTTYDSKYGRMPGEGSSLTFQGIVTGTGALTANINIEVSNDGVTPIKYALGTITLSGNSSDSDGFAASATWLFVRANLTSVSGTGAAVTCIMGA